MKKIIFLLTFTLLNSPAFSCGLGSSQDIPCEQGPMQLYLPRNKATISKNIHIEAVEFESEEKTMVKDLSRKLTKEILEKVNAVAINELSQSNKDIEVMVRYTFSNNKPTEFEMAKKAGKESDALLNRFYDSASEVKVNYPGFKIQIVLHYKITAV